MRSTVENVMTRDVVCAHDDTPYKELVELLATRHVSAVPIVDGRRHVLGVVSEADLLLKQERRARSAFWWLAAPHRRRERAKAEATVAAEVMSRPAATISARATLTEAARRLHAEGYKRLPVVDTLGRLVGIVSRVDLLKSFLRSDEELQREIVEEVIFDDLFMAPDRFDVHVHDGVVVTQGRC
jgi:CBS-domain-containing membrane protein